MTNLEIEALGKRYRDGERSTALGVAMADALRSVERGDADPGFGRDLVAALATMPRCSWCGASATSEAWMHLRPLPVCDAHRDVLADAPTEGPRNAPEGGQTGLFDGAAAPDSAVQGS